MNNEDARYLCVVCGGFIAHERYKLGYKTCLQCGEAAAREKKRKASMVQIHTARARTSTSSNPADLFHTNPKRTT
jgi:ribosomal protein L37AE/L43A